MPDENRTGIYIDFALPARRVRELGPRESHTRCAEDSEAFASRQRTLQPTACFLRLFFHSGDVFRVLVCAVTLQ